MVGMKAKNLNRKAFLLLAMLLAGGVASAQVVVKGSVYGGGQGIQTEERSGSVTGNATVTMNGGTVERSIYGGGELGSVGTFIDSTLVQYTTGDNAGKSVYIPKTCQDGTGLTTVIVNGGNVGVSERTKMPFADNSYEDDYGYIFGAGRGEGDSITHYKAIALGVSGNAITEINGSAFIHGSVYGGSENGLVLGNTRVAISGGQIGDGYYKDEHGVEHWDGLYTEAQWDTAIVKIKAGTFTADDAAGFHECDHWPYQAPYQPYDPYGNQGQPIYGSNGYTTYGNVFGGGSGYYPIAPGIWRRTAGQVNGNSEVVVTGGHILTSIFGGNEMTDVLCTSKVTMTGGTLGVPRTLAQIAAHPVTCYLFGAGKGDQRVMFNRWTNVQNAEVNIGGDAFFFGSVFGGGEDGHVLGNVTVDINTETGDDAYIGTWGYSYVDGNVFGGGRGFSGEGITCGSVGGDITVNINGGNILGSIYGGGRLASAGIGFALELDPIIGYFQPDIPDDPETPEDESETHGHVTINISGGTIGNDYESKLHLGNPDLEGGRTHGGNVFGGSMGRLTKLDGSINPKWPVLGQVKTTEINIEGDNTIIKGNVYGGGEFGLVLDSTEVNVRGGTIWRNVYGGGYGSNDNTTITDIQTGQAGVTFRYTPMAFAGVVSKKTFVNISGGWVKKNVYGGGEMASVGLIDYRLNNAGTDFENITKHDNEASSFALSWPYDYQYFTGFDGNTHVEITGGRIGITGKDFMGPWNASGTPLVIPKGETEYVAYDGSDAHKKALKAARQDNGDVYGGGHGIAGDRYDLAFCANANNTVVSVDITSDANPTTYKPNDWVYGFLPKANDWTNYGTLACIAGSVYGGAENGHVLNTANLTLDKGLIGHAIYGGGKGKDTYTVRLLNLGSTTEYHNAEIYSLTAGKVYGSTSVTMNGGYVMRNVYGGGNMASVGKGNYAGGSDDYSTAGYGEKVANLWTGGEDSDAWHFLNSGKATVNIVGGTVGTAGGEKDDLPTGNVFGGCRGEAAPNIPNTPRYQYAPSFFSGYVNMTDVTIGRLAEGTEGQEGYVAASGPLIYGSVYGGSQDGHVRRSTNVTVNYGEIGLAYNAANIANVGTVDENGNPVTSTHFKWLLRGNVTGSGSGIGKYEYDLPDSDPTLNYDSIINENHTFTYTYNGRTITLSEKDYSNSSGSVTDSTSVVINGGTIYRNIYGGGSLATVGPPYIPGTINLDEELGKPSHWSKNIVEVKSGTVGERNGVVAGYGGHVFGAGRGVETVDIEKFSTSVQTQVTIGSETTHDALVYGNVYGGGEVGQVSDDTEANVVSGQVGTIDYTDANNDGTFDGVTHTTGGKVFGGGKGLASVVEAARVKGNSNVNISGGHVLFNVYGGGETASVGLRNVTFVNPNDPTSTITAIDPVANTGLATVNITGGQVGPAPKVDLANGYNIPVGLNGFDGYVFGGGMGIGNDPMTDEDRFGKYYDLADVNNTLVTIDIHHPEDSINNRIWGSVFGGSEDGHVLGNARVKYLSGFTGTRGTTSWDGNIFGGGRNFNRKNYTAGRVQGNVKVEMSGGQILGSIFGGGRLAITGCSFMGFTLGDDGFYNAMLDGDDHGNIFVKVNGGKVGNERRIENFTDYSMGDVFGGGKGEMEGIDLEGHPKASALLLSLSKNTEVVVTDSINNGNIVSSPIIYGSVYGGGEVACVGNYKWKMGTYQGSTETIGDIQPKDESGIAKVTVTGGTIGVDNMRMRYDLAEGEGNYKLKYNCDIGHVFGGGEGRVDNPNDYAIINPSSGTPGVHNNKSLLDIMATVNHTIVTIGKTEQGSAFVKGSVYGGSMSGHVMGNTSVTISGGQVGDGYDYAAGHSVNRKYAEDKFFNPISYFVETHPTWHDVAPADTLAECYHWPYDPATNRPFDPVQLKNDPTYTPTDGKTWFGNVFGGGSGFYPYIIKNQSNQYEAHWNPESGKVYGSATVNITGGHVITSVYGGCENTDVVGKATVTMSDGTLGVPRTLAAIGKHPVTCYLFGAGKGDPRTYFNTWTNVDSVYVEVSGGKIYGSIFGGGEEGHVQNNVRLCVSDDAIIGTTGISYVDGNVFGGGRGFSGEALTAGTVGGNVKVNITGGTMLGSIYGGGRLASVGTHFADPNNPLYGQFTEDEGENTYGHVTVNISGGTIGNSHEYLYADHPLESKLTASIGGNVFAGSMGRLTKLDGTFNPVWPSLAKVKETKVNVSGTAVIKSCVYGGGQLGTVRDQATVNISGGTIGTDIVNTSNASQHYHFGSVYGGGFGSMDLEYTGAYANDSTANGLYKRPVEIAGRVYGNTFVNISGGQVLENVFGGGDLASIGMVKNGAMVNGVATVKMTGGQVGPLDGTGLNAYVYGGSKGVTNHDYKAYCNVNETAVTVDMSIADGNRVWGSLFGGGSDGHVLGDASVTMRQGMLGTTGTTSWDGNIFGGGRNYSAVSQSAGRVGGNVTVTMTGGTMLGSIFGGGRLGSVGVDVDGNMQEDNDGNTYGYVTVNVGGDSGQNDITIGHVATNHDDRVGGNVYGGGKGIAGAPTSIYPNLAKVKQTYVNIKEQTGKQTWIEGSVFGSGEDGHVLQDTYVNIYDGQIGGEEYGDLDPCDDPYHGNVYGGGRGVDTYEDPENPGTYLHSHTAGWVQGNTNVNMVGGNIIRNVYGGGNLASVGEADEPDPQPGQNYRTGLATVTITGGTVGAIGEDENLGNVFGSGHGGIGGEYTDLAFVKNTHVIIGGTAQIYGSVFGGGEDGHVRKNTLVDVKGGTIGTENDAYELNGNVYGGGRGLVPPGGTVSSTAGIVLGNSTVNIKNDGSYSPVIWNNVYGGGSASRVQDYKVVNISGGTVKQNVFGGSREIPSGRDNFAPRWVNMWGGTVEGNVYGCSYRGIDGDPANLTAWASFVNMSGGTVMGNVYGAGFSGEVKGSVAVLIGKNAIENAISVSDNAHRPSSVTAAKLYIHGNVFGGSNYYGTEQQSAWNQYDVSGYNRAYIDGTGYNTTSSDPDEELYMNIGGGLYGCGTHSESGKAGRLIMVKNYGTRNPGGNASTEMTAASRQLTTLQRGGVVLFDNANVKFSGQPDISGQYPDRIFGVLQVDNGLYATNASGIVLGSVTHPAYMDSIKEVRSLRLRSTATGDAYTHSDPTDETYWEWIGIKNSDNNLYHTESSGGALTTAQENVIIFNGDSRMMVRYKDKTADKVKYGALTGFFRMRADAFQIYGMESFAYARPKVTAKVNPIAGHTAPENNADGGFLSYDTPKNMFTQKNLEVLGYTYQYDNNDGGADSTKTKQYPYYNLSKVSKNGDRADTEDYRMWVLPVTLGHKWYVDGRGIGNGGWGQDKSHGENWGDFPDKPKLTITGAASGTDIKGGICVDQTPNPVTLTGGDYIFNPEKDIIFVVGPINSALEQEILNMSNTYPLQLFRYPGGHKMSNGETDVTVFGNPAINPMTPTDDDYNGLVNIDFEHEYPDNPEYATYGPGANYGAMINVSDALVMNNVVVDGLYEYTGAEVTQFEIPESYATEKLNVSKPLVVTTSGATLTLKGARTTSGTDVVTNGTILQRGYNNTDAATTWYHDADYTAASGVHDGGGLYVDDGATVKVQNLVTIEGNKQKNGTDVVKSNVYLPTFTKSLTITDTLTATTKATSKIGITSPIRNRKENYVDNTFSPVAVATASATVAANVIASKAWENCNFTDDQNWFFVNRHNPNIEGKTRTTYYSSSTNKALSNTALYFGWTWANVVRRAPQTGDLSGDVTDAFAYDNINSAHDLAWLISQSMGLNGETATNFSGQEILQTGDIDLQQYVWVPIGEQGEGLRSFAGTYDGQGHLITNLSIDYIGLGDRRYERKNYGLFGYVNGLSGNVNNGKVNRTFVVSGKINPQSSRPLSEAKDATSETPSVEVNIGGLVGSINGATAMISNSESAVDIECPNHTSAYKVVAGGLVGQLQNGTVHSSMAMNKIVVKQLTEGQVGGLVGLANTGKVLNSFANVEFGATGNDNKVKIGGLVGKNEDAEMANCYANLHKSDAGSWEINVNNFAGIVAHNSVASKIDSCYVMQEPTTWSGSDYGLTIDGTVHNSCGKYTPVMGADNLGYMYADNRVNSSKADTSMLVMLNKWARYNNRTGRDYAYWARPGLPEINGDLPVLMLSEGDQSHNHQGGFRSLGTYAGSHVLQYGGPVRDNNSEVAGALTRAKADASKDDYLFIYGDVNAVGTGLSITQSKVSIYENASILSAGGLSGFGNTYVGITFDNSCGHAYSTPGMNYGIVGMGGFLLPRDWHMFSTPLSNAPQGFNYKGQNKPQEGHVAFNSLANDNQGFYNNPWVNMNTEFSWLSASSPHNVRYWMKGWSDSQIQNQVFDADAWEDGYFPSSLSSLHPFGTGWISNSDEYGRYPYGMDFYTWYEPGYHWINFKRNGPNHWHSDENGQGVHEHLDYYGDGVNKNVNEETLITGRGYMAAISVPTFMQSHGTVNSGDKNITLTQSGAHCTGWNLVGNPYHGFLDFNAFATTNTANLATKGNNPFYVIYDADAYSGVEGNGFLYYPEGGSVGGEYAGRFIHPHQGFFVLAKEEQSKEDKSLKFTESMIVPRSTVKADSLFREQQPNYPLINLYLSSDNGCRDVTVIEFNRPEWGGATKLRELRQGNGAFYGYHDEQRYAALFTKVGTPRVPLWFEAHEDDIFTMKWKTANADFQSLYLIDNLLGIQYDMLANDTYVFEGHKQDYYSRFYIVFDVTDIEEHDGNDGFVFFEGSQWMVTGDGDLDFIDMNGRVLWTGHVSGQQRVSLPNVAAGIYMFRLVDSNSVKIQKVIVKKQ